jgi:hypothetical protein
MTEIYSQDCHDGTQGALWGCPSELEEWSSSGSIARVQELTSVASEVAREATVLLARLRSLVDAADRRR